MTWANSILEKPVKLPLRMRYDELWQRLNKAKSGVVLIEDFYSVAYNCKEFTDFVKNHYSDNQIISYYRTKLAEYSHPREEGAIKLMAELLNMGYSVEEISELSCIDEEGPRFDYQLFVEGLCETWVMIPEEYVGDIRPLSNILYELRGIFGWEGDIMIMGRGLQARHIYRYIPVDELKQSLISVLGNSEIITSIVDEEHDDLIAVAKITTTLPSAYNKFQYDKVQADIDLREVCNDKNLANWKPGIKMASILEGEIKQIAEGIRRIICDRDRLLEDPYIAKRFDKDVIEGFGLNIQMVLDSIKGPEQLVERAVEQDIVLTEEGWKNFEFVDDEARKGMLLSCIGVFKEKREILTALMENKELFDEYIYSIL